MPDTKMLDKSLGSRHRAALGITEETDAVVVVVSEERGTISFCFNGNIVSNLDGASLRQALLGLFGQRPRKKKALRRSATQTGSYRISQVPGAPVSSGNTGAVILSPPSARGDTGRIDLPREVRGEKVDTPRTQQSTPIARPLAPAKIETPKPMPAVDMPAPPRDPSDDH
jgi:diadenylate cyclase